MDTKKIFKKAFEFSLAQLMQLALIAVIYLVMTGLDMLGSMGLWKTLLMAALLYPINVVSFSLAFGLEAKEASSVTEGKAWK